MKLLATISQKFLGICVAATIYYSGEAMAANLETITINNVDIPIIYEESSLAPVFDMKLIFQGGGILGTYMATNKAYSSSISELGAALLNEGTKELGSVKFAQKLEEKAIDISVSSGTETLSISLTSLKEDAQDAINFLDSLLKSPNLTENALNNVKQDAISAILQKETDFDEVANDMLKELLFKGTPCAQIPTQSSIKKVTLQDIQSYYKRHIVLNNLTILAGGDMPFEDFKKHITPMLSQFKKGDSYPIQKCNVATTPSTKTIQKPTQQAYISFGSPLSVNDYATENYKMRIAAFVLGAGGFGSRLLEEVRVKKGLAYSAYWRSQNTKSATYALGYLQTKLESKDEAIDIVKNTIKEFVEHGITQKELESAKKFILGSEPLNQEKLSQRLSRAYNAYYHGMPISYNKDELKKIQSVQLQEINDYIKKHDEILHMSFAIVENEK